MLSAPFPWFGGKSRVADLVWEWFGKPDLYVEPFAGSLAVLLSQSEPVASETVNDADGHLVNFWRSVRYSRDRVLDGLCRPPAEVELAAIFRRVRSTRGPMAEAMRLDYLHHDPDAAAAWAYLACCSVGRIIASNGNDMPAVRDAPAGIMRLPREERYALLESLSARLQDVTIMCGDWTRAVTPVRLGNERKTCAVFLDPPYDEGEHDGPAYHTHSGISRAVREWAIENGARPELRIALCGYAGEHRMPDDWDEVAWKAAGGYGSQGDGRGRDNALRERIWFSPHCTTPQQISMF